MLEVFDSNHVFDYSNYVHADAIIMAIRWNDSNGLQQLMEKCPKMADDLKQTALDLAATKRTMKCLQVLFEYDSPLNDIHALAHEAVTTLQPKSLNSCLENDEILSRKDPRLKALANYSALYFAVRTNNLKAVETFLNHPENIHLTDSQGFTPLHLAAGCGHLEICQILLEKGADPQSTDGKYRIPLNHAYVNKNLDIAHLLIKRDLTTIHHQDKYFERTPLMLAAESGDSVGVRMLLENGAKVEIFDRKGLMALHHVAWSGDAELLEFMLRYTDTSYVEKLTMNIMLTLFESVDWCTLYSLTCCAICSKNVECLKVLVSSKFSKNFLQLPFVLWGTDFKSPLTYLLEVIRHDDENLDAFLQVFFKHKITMVHDFFRPTTPVKWQSYSNCRFFHPFSFLTRDYVLVPFSKQQYYLNLLIANDITIDYCLQCYRDNNTPYSLLIDFSIWYESLWKILVREEVEFATLVLSNSSILEPDKVIAHYVEPPKVPLEDPWPYCRVYKYLISLKPVHCMKLKCRHPQHPYSSFQEEFFHSSLQQLCRTVIRHHLRDYTYEDNLRNFKKKIMELPLPSSLKDYLLFKY